MNQRFALALGDVTRSGGQRGEAVNRGPTVFEGMLFQSGGQVHREYAQVVRVGVAALGAEVCSRIELATP